MESYGDDSEDDSEDDEGQSMIINENSIRPEFHHEI